MTNPLTPEDLAHAEAVEAALAACDAFPIPGESADILAAEVRRLRGELDRVEARVTYLNGQEGTWARIAIKADSEAERLSEKNTSQGLALAQAEHELAQLAAEIDKLHAQLNAQAPVIAAAKELVRWCAESNDEVPERLLDRIATAVRKMEGT